MPYFPSLIIWRDRDVRHQIRFLGAEVVGKLLAIETSGVALLDLRKHRTIPLVPLPGKPVIYVLLAVLQVGAFERVLHAVEEGSIVEDFEEFVFAIARPSLGIRLLGAVQRARDQNNILGQGPQENHAIP